MCVREFSRLPVRNFAHADVRAVSVTLHLWSERLCTKVIWALFAPALPPDVRRGYASPLRLGEAGLGPWSGLWPIELGAKPEPGAQPILKMELNGEA